MADLYTIVLKEDRAVDADKYGKLLAPVLGIPVVEARLVARRGRGIFVADLPEHDARILGGKLEDDGIPCWVVPNHDLPNLTVPLRATLIERTASGLRFRGGETEFVTVDWGGIGVLSIGLVSVPELDEEYPGTRKKDHRFLKKTAMDQRDLIRDRILEALRSVDRPPPGAPAPKRLGSWYLWFEHLRRFKGMHLRALLDVVPSDASAWLRVLLDDMAYVDGSDGRPSGFAIANYFLAATTFARRPDAHTEMSRRLLRGEDIPDLVFPTIEEFNRYTRWHAFRIHLSRMLPQAAAPSGDGTEPTSNSEPGAP